MIDICFVMAVNVMDFRDFVSNFMKWLTKKDIDLGICEDMVRPHYQRMNGLIYSRMYMMVNIRVQGCQRLVSSFFSLS